MATQVTLKVKEEDGTVKKEQHEIEDIDLLQFEQMMKVIKEIFVQVQEDESLKQLFRDLFLEESSEADDEVIEIQDQHFISNLINSFETIAVHMPAKGVKLLSVLSGIETHTLQKQKVLDVLDIYDAVIDENDLERLWKRAKKSLAATKAKMTFVNLRRKATEKPVAKKAQA
ncbi:hypothetical protein [Halobacillus sp. A5]|uniref:hypothetical protein n=1 Tax=Halobacillus sp. A5 TaxID=2880263 RepID=UPI0020A6C4A0|nr:hypothetical protein [Halobacillus sp. A5]MCP3026602.1 hypothetical protein [Halobacillus sp. A5]